MNFWVWCLGLSISNTLHSGRKTHITTDHKPLIPLFQKSITNTRPRLSRLLLRVSEFDVQLHCEPSLRMKLSDTLSRKSSHNTDDRNHCEVKGLNISVHEIDVKVSGCKMSNIWKENQNNDIIQFLIKHILEGRLESQDKCPDSIKGFYSFHYELSMVEGLVLKGSSRINIPKRLRQNALNKLHISHLGNSKMILHARICVLARN